MHTLLTGGTPSGTAQQCQCLLKRKRTVCWQAGLGIVLGVLLLQGSTAKSACVSTVRGRAIWQACLPLVLRWLWHGVCTCWSKDNGKTRQQHCLPVAWCAHAHTHTALQTATICLPATLLEGQKISHSGCMAAVSDKMQQARVSHEWAPKAKARVTYEPCEHRLPCQREGLFVSGSAHGGAAILQYTQIYNII